PARAERCMHGERELLEEIRVYSPRALDASHQGPTLVPGDDPSSREPLNQGDGVFWCIGTDDLPVHQVDRMPRFTRSPCRQRAGEAPQDALAEKLCGAGAMLWLARFQ
ncbi:MAG: hypothetical protein VX000_07525, partial [Myxococcota bacterium]|nr:hypothetical protein [Myxococcota bacterium]